jgi:hypothetical protein
MRLARIIYLFFHWKTKYQNNNFLIFNSFFLNHNVIVLLFPFKVLCYVISQNKRIS